MADNRKTDVFGIIAEKFEGTRTADDKLYFDKYDLTIEFRTAGERVGLRNSSVQLLFILTHPLFEETLVESCAGIGEDAESAAKNSAENFCDSVLKYVLESLDGKNTAKLVSEIDGEKHEFSLPSEIGSYCTGDSITDGDLWSIVKDDIPNYIGKKRAYWIKLFVGAAKGEISCEVRINGTVMTELTAKVREEISKKNTNSENYNTHKQFVLLIQDESTYEPCPYTADDVKKWTNKAIELLRKVKSQKSYEKTAKEIIETSPDSSLGRELTMFVPEMMCGMVFGLRDGDGISAMNKNGKDRVDMKKSQLRSFGYIESAVYTYLMKNKPKKDDIMNIIAASSRFSALQKAIQDGAKPENIVFNEMIYLVTDDYKIW